MSVCRRASGTTHTYIQNDLTDYMFVRQVFGSEVHVGCLLLQPAVM